MGCNSSKTPVMSDVAPEKADNKSTVDASKMACRMLVIPTKPNSKEAILAYLNSGEMKKILEPHLDDLVSISMVVLDEGTVCTTSIYTSMEAMTKAEEAVGKAMAGLKEFIAGPPDKVTGDVDWDVKGKGKKADGPLACRMTTIPTKSNSKEAILAYLNSDEMKKNMELVLDDLVQVTMVVLDEGTIRSRALFASTEAMTKSEEAVGKVMAGLKQFIAGAPSKVIGTVDWDLKGKAA